MMHRQKHKSLGATSKKLKKTTKTSMFSVLHEDEVVEIISQLVACSPQPLADLYSLRNTCKLFCSLSTDKLVKQRLAVGREFSKLKWRHSDRCMDILNACANVGNAEACFILALVHIYNLGDLFKGAKLLKEATSKGHSAALYLMNVMHLRLQQLVKPPAADLLPPDIFNADASNLYEGDQLALCREKVLDIIRQVTWDKWQPSRTGKTKPCTSSSCGIARGWDEHRSFCSDKCRWNHEDTELCRGM